MRNTVSIVALVAVAGLASGAGAAIKTLGTPESSIPAPAGVARGIADATGTGFEAGEGFVLGNINGQQGWSTNAPRGSMEVTNGVGDGNGSPNALRLGKGPQAQNQTGVAFSPFFVPGSIDLHDSNVDTRINDDFGADYWIVGGFLSGTSVFTTWRVQFNYEGNIFVVDGAAFVDTGVAWAQNGWRNLRVVVDDVNGAIDYYYGGSLLYSGGLAFAGNTAVEGFIFVHDNFQDAGNGAFSGGPAAGYFDNLIPAPGAMALLGMGGLLAARRRR